MRKFAKDFLLRGLVSAWGGPLVLAIVYGLLGATGEISSLTPREVCAGILSVMGLAFVAAGMNAVYQVERLPLVFAIGLHGAVLYGTYILVFLMNGWLQRQRIAVLVFTAIFLTGYGLIWVIIYTVTKLRTRKLNRYLRSEQ